MELLQEYCRVVKVLLSMGKKVVLIYETPEIGWNAQPKVQRNRIQGITTDLTVSYEHVKARNRDVNLAFDKLQHVNLTKIYPEQILCDSTTNRCRVQNGTQVYYEDSHHLDPVAASDLFGDVLTQALHL
jgi:hypothetical protein